MIEFVCLISGACFLIYKIYKQENHTYRAVGIGKDKKEYFLSTINTELDRDIFEDNLVLLAYNTEENLPFVSLGIEFFCIFDEKNNEIFKVRLKKQ